MRTSYRIRLPKGQLTAGHKTLLMGIINATPDSFFGGSCRPASEEAIGLGLQFLLDGADILDVGGESTRPAAMPVDQTEEARRVIPVVAALVKSSAIPVSIDTYKSSVAHRALQEGAQIVNDISGFKFDPALPEVVQEFKAAVVLSHIRGMPETMHHMPPSPNILEEVIDGLSHSVDRAQRAGIAEDRIIVDPGIGFGKTAEESLALINGLDRLNQLGFPILIGVSRKSFIGKILGQKPEERLHGTAAAVACSILRGAHIVRVHDVAAMRHVVRVTDSIVGEQVVE
jgi:dihydropteroate synthase